MRSRSSWQPSSDWPRQTPTNQRKSKLHATLHKLSLKRILNIELRLATKAKNMSEHISGQRPQALQGCAADLQQKQPDRPDFSLVPRGRFGHVFHMHWIIEHEKTTSLERWPRWPNRLYLSFSCLRLLRSPSFGKAFSQLSTRLSETTRQRFPAGTVTYLWHLIPWTRSVSHANTGNI